MAPAAQLSNLNTTIIPSRLGSSYLDIIHHALTSSKMAPSYGSDDASSFRAKVQLKVI